MKRFLLILTFFLFFTNTFAYSAQKTVVKLIKTSTADGFTINSVLKFPAEKNKKNYQTVIMLHSLGYSSEWWEDLPDKMLNKGYAVLLIDLRGHGKSVFNGKLTRISWKDLTNKAYSRYPDDVTAVMKSIKDDYPKMEFFKDYVFVGSDIGACTAVLAASKLEIKPKTIVMLSPQVNCKGLYIPVKMAEIGSVDILSIRGRQENDAEKAQEYLKKFAQSAFAVYVSEANKTGMLLIKNDKTLSVIISEWIAQYLKN